ncbi:hypothetical protein CHCC20335_1724 [Bacillus paralicheniformis]|nr:hypothetical protein CHCC20335_1724 [Bacillus paralicheniformis]
MFSYADTASNGENPYSHLLVFVFWKYGSLLFSKNKKTPISKNEGVKSHTE